jgi:hypothetical protein
MQMNDLIEEYKKALEELKQAEDNFNNADNDFVPAAALQLKAKTEKVNTIYRKLKGVAV